jgi:hypothetical protein
MTTGLWFKRMLRSFGKAIQSLEPNCDMNMLKEADVVEERSFLEEVKRGCDFGEGVKK